MRDQAGGMVRGSEASSRRPAPELRLKNEASLHAYSTPSGHNSASHRAGWRDRDKFPGPRPDGKQWPDHDRDGCPGSEGSISGTPMTRRDYGSGSVYQRASDGRWVGAIDHGYTPTGARRRITVTGKTEGEAKRKLRDKKHTLESGEAATGPRVTVKQWAETYLSMRLHDLSPKGYNAAANPIRNWVIPTIGHRRLDTLTPGDIRAIHTACRTAGRQAGDVHRVTRTMLNAAVKEGHHVPPRVLLVEAPRAHKSDRAAMTIPEGIACLEVASTLPHGSRWLFTLLYGARLGECLGLTWDAVDLDAGASGEAGIEWQLQSLPYLDHADKSKGFRVPDGHESRHLVDAFHLVRPKSRAGYRIAPLLPPVRDALAKWRSAAPANPWGLVWPTIAGRPANDKHDRLEWHALQGTAGIAHPTRTDKDGNPVGYHVHECRNFAATMLLDAGVEEHVVADLLGHSTVVTSLRYRTRRRAPLYEGMSRAAEPLRAVLDHFAELG